MSSTRFKKNINCEDWLLEEKRRILIPFLRCNYRDVELIVCFSLRRLLYLLGVIDCFPFVSQLSRWLNSDTV